jgi:predicted Fe-S protein YdhL (DUF1289 family)
MCLLDILRMNQKIKVSSPCIGICILRSVKGGKVCEGCFRTAREIENWSSMDEFDKYRAKMMCRRRREELQQDAEDV